ncbi:Pyruvate ferredoxin/flavodoxin oxidoreductase family protein [Desulfamplus magnetovallimortis]|uniref:Pyruvate ferredoxin/flavodoxin oxidoreductase family protein n=1 Tax=Desulfamplus magnetovallimortis TaxID=1246637 RepID=A0A1W1HH97_9BACT|nr:2-oxoacid:acceptor oxidoreductase family protein [Desulfamplus magnetovallimortis]SLM31803.1 Pyruvate ferredoxin/flavodoxin oxidoreductase family protein [Desulfamplus magnetovallimortis]
MQKEVMFAGFGGQGILLSAKLLAYAAMKQGSQVMWIPSYGPEMRGGTAYCTVVVSDRLIGSPIIKNPAHLVAMNRPSLEKFAQVVKPNGVVMINSSLIPVRTNRDDVQELIVPANEIAVSLGSVKCANIVAVSAFAAKSGMVDVDILRECIKSEFASKAKLIPLNMKAFDEGLKIAAAS